MIATYGLTHVALNVRDLDRTLAFYQSVFGAVVSTAATTSSSCRRRGLATSWSSSAPSAPAARPAA